MRKNLKSMKVTVLLIILFTQIAVFAQKPCEYVTNITDSIGTLKETKSFLIHEKVFGNASQYIFMSLLLDNNSPILNLQIIQKSSDFLMPKCLDKNSKIYFQLSNGKMYTVFSRSPSVCDTFLYNESDKMNNRFLDADFLFVKNDYEDIKKFPIVMMRIKYATETTDYILAKELKSERLKEISSPENLFIDNFKCIE